jgi:DNA-binding MarR family transcriptional regulator
MIKPYVDNFLIQRVVRDDNFLSHQEKLILFILSTYRNTYHLICDPSLDELAASFGRSTRTVQRVLAKLEKKRWIMSVRRGRKKTNNYYFTPDLFRAFEALQCPRFNGWKSQLQKLQSRCKNGGFVVSKKPRHDTMLSHPYTKRKAFEKNPKTTQTCPHCLRHSGKDAT